MNQLNHEIRFPKTLQRTKENEKTLIYYKSKKIFGNNLMKTNNLDNAINSSCNNDICLVPNVNLNGMESAVYLASFIYLPINLIYK